MNVPSFPAPGGIVAVDFANAELPEGTIIIVPARGIPVEPGEAGLVPLWLARWSNEVGVDDGFEAIAPSFPASEVPTIVDSANSFDAVIYKHGPASLHMADAAGNFATNSYIAYDMTSVWDNTQSFTLEGWWRASANGVIPGVYEQSGAFSFAFRNDGHFFVTSIPGLGSFVLTDTNPMGQFLHFFYQYQASTGHYALGFNGRVIAVLQSASLQVVPSVMRVQSQSDFPYGQGTSHFDSWALYNGPGAARYPFVVGPYTPPASEPSIPV